MEQLQDTGMKMIGILIALKVEMSLINKPKGRNNYFHFYSGLLLLLLLQREFLSLVPLNLHTNPQSWALLSYFCVEETEVQGGEVNDSIIKIF